MFYKPIKEKPLDNVKEAISSAKKGQIIIMILNTSETVILNIHLTNNSEVYKEICSQGITEPFARNKIFGSNY